jgi:hypothetical protein
MGISPVTLPVVVERTRDVKEAVRVKAYEMLGFGAKPEDLRVQGSNLHIQGVWIGGRRGISSLPRSRRLDYLGNRCSVSSLCSSLSIWVFFRFSSFIFCRSSGTYLFCFCFLRYLALFLSSSFSRINGDNPEIGAADELKPL